ncbi:MAG TPA: cytochrome c biogenesis protein CcdA [Streptosporangiaceae bacterium]|nr:cytochrome c biogenesis protein CcdA [Streptosporangiaceae bacterium]
MGGGIGHLVLSGPLILAVPVAAAAGAVTFLSPCVLPLVPGYLSYVAGMSGVDAQASPAAGDGRPAGTGSTATVGSTVAADSTAAADSTRAASSTGAAGSTAPAPGAGGSGGGTAVKAPAATVAASPGRPRTVTGTALFVLGFSLVFATEGVAFGGLGSVLRTHIAGLTQILGGFTIILGLLFAGVFDRFPVTGRIIRPSVRPRAGLAGAPVLGVMFGLSWTPCIGPTLSVVMGLALTSGTAVRGALLMFVYGLGLGIPFLIVALLFQRGMTTFGFARRHARLITRVGGALLVAVGVLELTGAWTSAMQWIQTHWIAGVKSPL